MTLIDAQARQQALDPTQSFIVQAPAGSGKTELLTQRFLRLLSLVTQPEQVVALTFTRKAANEMRERIMHALLAASTLPPPASHHKQTTFEFARAALARSEQFGWQLLTMPSRLRITTIDSLCHTLAQAIPLHEQHTPFAQINTTPETLYLNASTACYQFLLNSPAHQEALTCLLEHLDNRPDQLVNLFLEQLRSRDQWLGIVHQAKSQDKTHYEYALAAIISHEIQGFKATIPPDCLESLLTLCKQVGQCVPDKYHALRDWQSWDELDGNLLTTLANLLLTRQATLRKAFDHHVGVKNNPELKTHSKNLLATLHETHDFLPTLLRVQHLPKPHYDQQQWQVLQALLTILPLLAAHLQLLFNQHNQVDFIAIAQQASLALGDADTPTDLALYLDYSLHHLLIDEFQDTSLQQFSLLSQLVEGFSYESGKTLFVVGDPMQSIYRFRGAEVGLFLRAKQYGIGPIKLNFLALACNFRANKTLVSWINQQFRHIFPLKDDLESGAIAFHAATAANSGSDEPAVYAFNYCSREHQAAGLVELISTQLTHYPEQNIALLIRSRSQLKPIIRALRDHRIPYQGTEIDCIAALPHIRDVWSLTQALLMPANRLAWLSFLRSPWCGLMLADLHALAQINRKKSIVFALNKLHANEHLFTTDGLIRLRFVGNTLLNALFTRAQQSLVDWVMTTLHNLQLELLLTPGEQDELEQYWQLISQFESNGQLTDLARFKQALDSLYSKSSTHAALQILTIHKAKGLEFDCVILPSLSSKAHAPSQPLLRWLTLPTVHSEPLVLLSPVHASTHSRNELYDYLTLLDHVKSNYEQQRLLYVAVTRAKKHLFLLDFNETPTRQSLRALLTQQPFTPIADTRTIHSAEISLPQIDVLALDYYQNPPLLISPTYSNRLPDLSLHDPLPRLLGLAAHELLQWICTHHPTALSDIPASLIRSLIQQHAIEQTARANAHARLLEFITPLFTTTLGRWLIAAHTDEHNEYQLLAVINEEVHTQIIDRTFIDQGIRWIIDFKTGREDPEATLQHKAQVNTYARSLSIQAEIPIRCGLYYLPTQHWVEWEYDIMILSF